MMRTGEFLVQPFLCSINTVGLKNSAQHFLQMWVFCRVTLLCPLSLHHHSLGSSLEHLVPCGCSPWPSSKLMCWGFTCMCLDMVHTSGCWEEPWWLVPLSHQFLELGNFIPLWWNVHVPVIPSFLCPYFMGRSYGLNCVLPLRLDIYTLKLNPSKCLCLEIAFFNLYLLLYVSNVWWISLWHFHVCI